MTSDQNDQDRRREAWEKLDADYFDDTGIATAHAQAFNEGLQVATTHADEFGKMVESGTKAWADVPSATQFVEELRGNETDKLTIDSCVELAKEHDALTWCEDMPKLLAYSQALEAKVTAKYKKQLSAYARDIEKAVLEIDKAGLPKGTSPEAAINMLVFETAKLREEVEKCQRLYGYECEIRAQRGQMLLDAKAELAGLQAMLRQKDEELRDCAYDEEGFCINPDAAETLALTSPTAALEAVKLVERKKLAEELIALDDPVAVYDAINALVGDKA